MIKQNFLVALFCLFSVVCMYAEDALVELPPVFNEKIGTEEKEKLLRGETVIRNVGKMKNVCIKPNAFSDVSPIHRAYSALDNLDPAYLAEVIQIRPIKGNENLPAELHDAVLDIKSYIGIPYWSVRHECYYDLYSDAEIVSQKKDGNIERICADLTMSPFGVIHADILSELTADAFYYQLMNLNDLSYHDRFKCVSANCMISTVAVERYGDYWILYGLGGVDAPSIFFLRDRIETSFINRIKTFCVFFFSKEKELQQKDM